MKTHLLLIATGAILFGTSLNAQVTVPYTNDFSSDAADFTPNGGTWGVDSVTEKYDVRVEQTVAQSAISLLNTSGLGQGVDFIMSTDFTGGVGTNPADLTNTTVGFAALGDSSNPTTFILADFSVTNSAIRILGFGFPGGNQTIASDTLGFAVSSGTQYALTLTGSFSETGIDLSFIVSDGVNSKTVTGTTSLDVFTGDYYGLRTRKSAGGPVPLTAFEGSFDNFSLSSGSTIPEPGSTAALFGAAGLISAGLFRRRR